MVASAAMPLGNSLISRRNITVIFLTSSLRPKDTSHLRLRWGWHAGSHRIVCSVSDSFHYRESAERWVALERRTGRPRHPHLSASQGPVREATISTSRPNRGLSVYPVLVPDEAVCNRTKAWFLQVIVSA